MLCWRTLCESCEVCQGCTRLLKTAFKQSAFTSHPRSTHLPPRMSLSLSIDRALPSLPGPAPGDFDKENSITTCHLDRTELYLASPTKTFTSPSKFSSIRQATSPRVRLPLEDQDPNSQDSGYGAGFSSDDVKPSFRFAEPLRMAPRKTSIEPSPRKELTPSPQSKRSSSLLQPSSFCSRSSSSGSESIDDGFMELFMSDKMDEETQLPSGMNDLLSGSIHKSRLSVTSSVSSISPSGLSPYSDSPLLLHLAKSSCQSEDVIPKPSFRRSLSTSDSFTPASSRVVKVRTSLFKQSGVVRSLDHSSGFSPIPEAASPVSQLASSKLSSLHLSNSGSFKRPDPPSDKQSPIQIKRRKFLQCIQDNLNDSSQSIIPQYACQKTAPPKFQRCFSETEATIKSALSRASTNPDLIGDFSKPFALPLMEGRHQDLKSISVQTLAALIEGEFKDEIANFTIVDCRYPYEYEGGHIRGAKNFYTKEQIVKEFVNSKDGVNKTDTAEETNKRSILIFHCEFSSERGPNLSRFLRNSDRDTNKECYPALDYPEMYLLNGGYKLFFEKFRHLCDPQSYRPMTHPDHENDLRKFRSKSKSWNGGDGKNRLYPKGVGMKRLGL